VKRETVVEGDARKGGGRLVPPKWKSRVEKPSRDSNQEIRARLPDWKHVIGSGEKRMVDPQTEFPPVERERIRSQKKKNRAQVTGDGESGAIEKRGNARD